MPTLSNSNWPTYRTTSTTYSSRPWRQALMLLVRLLPPIDQNLTRCAERTNAFNACSSSEDDYLSTPSISPYGVHYKRRGRCQIPGRMSTHLPTQRCKSALWRITPTHLAYIANRWPPRTRATPPLRSPSAQAASSTALLVVAHTTHTNCSLPSYIEGATYATLTNLMKA